MGPRRAAGLPLIVAHRGESYLAPENTSASVSLAWKCGDDAVEVDVHLTADEQIVVCHDADTFRTSGEKARLPLKDTTLARIQTVDVGSFKGTTWAGERCPTLRDLWRTMPRGKHCFTEIKCGVEILPALAALYRELRKTPAAITIISFHADVIAASKKLLPDVKHHFLACHKPDGRGGYASHPNVDDFIAVARQIGADGLDLRAEPPLDQAACAKVKAAGLELHLWTIDDPEIARQYIAWGADSITTNRAAWMREQLSR